MQEHWQSAKFWGWILWPFSLIFVTLATIRKFVYRLFAYKAKVPIIVVGNISLGGTGKTPTVIYLAQLLKDHGYTPGIVTRGYKGSANASMRVSNNSDPSVVGDEAIVLARRTQCPVVVAKQRVVGVKLLQDFVDVIICDDGLQHYKLARDIEIAVVDANKQFGNGFCLPMGPLRESRKRLATVDVVLINGIDMQLQPDSILVGDGQLVHAVAGIGNPQRFFTMLINSGFKVIAHSFPDHHVYVASDLEFADQHPIYMTEKDAVKCQQFGKNFVTVKVTAHMNMDFDHKILTKLQEQQHAKRKST